jgi:hypothetical protein
MVNFYQITQRYNPEDSHLCIHHCENLKSYLDHILDDRRHCINVCDVRSKRGTETESYHYLVHAKMKLKIKRNERIKRSNMGKWDINKLAEEGKREEFMEEISSNICSREWEEQQNIDEMWTKIKN